MAIEKSRSVQKVEVYPAAGDEDPRVEVFYEHTFDDADDDELPVTQTQLKHLTSDTDYSNEDALVISICDAVWS